MGVVLWKLRQVMGDLQRDYQIIVVDDASTDSTPAVLSPYIRVLPLTVIRNSERRGYADSLELAIREALRRSPYPKRDAVITIQADFTEDPDVVPAMIKRFEAGADLVATEVATEENTPRAMRWGRRFMRWLVRGREWSAIGDPLSGLRVYRVVALKRAVEVRGSGRLLTHQGWGAHVELLAQTVPHSRRNDVVETTLKEHRLQRASRFSFMRMLREVRGAASGRPAANAGPLPTDSIIAQPLPIAAEPVRSHERHQRRGSRDSTRRPRRDGAERSERPARATRAPRPAPAPAPRAPRPDRP
ncbi:MAG TPA: glycosyltransferase family 2 protein, partial [Longimicrobiales bacterium]